ncbi:hypothetical protein GOP47_0029882 [Adiantum capillus-veneris]|nr:hypothetical protein GOP47_0029882 [Adiantum capillus-veneris]
MRRRLRRKQQQKQPISSNEQASGACDSSFSLYCMPLFYLLLFGWIAFFALNPALSHYAGSHTWSIPWLSGVHADINNEKHNAVSNAVTLDTQSVVPPMNESNASRVWRSPKERRTGPVSVHDRKCKPLLFKDLLISTSFSAYCHSPHDDKKKSSDSNDLSRDLRSVSYIACKEGQASLSPADDTGNDGAQDTFDNSWLPQSEDGGPVNDDGDLQPFPFNLPEGHSTRANIDDHRKTDEDDHRQTDEEKVAEYGVDDDSRKDEEYQSIVSLDNQTDSSLPGNDTDVKENSSALIMSDIINKTHPSLMNLSRVHLRQDPGDGPYNYASDSKGAKILANNKEAKGASNILNKDEDKYFRTPCNVEAKYVEMELSEEMLVVEIAIANHEFYSSNVREFALWGSLSYPTGEWQLLGKFEAENTRVSKTFSLKEPQWVRYLKLQMLSHYGSDFYCTLSAVEVYGVDAIEWFLEDWIAEESGVLGSHISSSTHENSSVSERAVLPATPQGQTIDKDVNPEEDLDSMLTRNLEDTLTEKPGDLLEGNGKKMKKSQPVYHQTGRPALDAVMKLLMQKVRTLEQKQPSLSRSLEEMEARYREVLGTHSNEAAVMVRKMESVATEIANLNALLHFMEGEWKRERRSLEEDILDQVKSWNTNFEFLRYQLKRMQDKELPAKQKEAMLLSCRTALQAVPLLSCILVVLVLSI